MTDLVTRADVEAAATILDGVAVRTALEPLAAVPGLRLKREDTQPIGAFKLRGAFHAAARLDPEVRARGLVTHSSGNHGRALAWTAQRLGVPCTVVVPDDAVAPKVEAMAALGARLVSVAPADRAVCADEIVAETGGALVPPFDHPHVIAGQGTVGLELLGADVDRVLVPVGGGGLISGIAAALAGSGVSVVGVEPELAGDAAASKRAGELLSWPAADVARTAADGLRASRLGELPWRHVAALVDDVVTVGEDAIGAAARLLHGAGVPAEASGAVATAGALTDPTLVGDRTVAIVSGRNVDPVWVARVLAA
ncbi:threonine/serine dehydratase [Actinomycetospora sp. NBRC 106378]|uniref:threonine ammonia-lyase n=1 Tax=Actinomycetospora sp. NBRC 106378 TaxID=3032208 RepID=UPI0024A4F2EF|nr:threonine/serine dehydratase [Actinomycetospora sp. NBRC 106378]GLZ51128.1 serine/threonine dehydratase [Actinomycetospora sp. NBRC 106378]